MTDKEMMFVVGESGNSSESGSDDEIEPCLSGEFHCICNGVYYGCKKEFSDCWNNC